MKTLRQSTLAIALMASISCAAIAQNAPPPPAGPPPAHHMEHGGQRPDPQKMQEHMAKRAAELKQKLQLTAAQEGSWNQYMAAMKPPATRPAHPTREDFEKLSTPERIDKMREMRAARQVEMDKHANATKAFYATLNSEQKKVFDTETARMHRHGPGKREH